MAVSEAQKDEVRHATDIVQLVGEHVALKPKGREFLCLCPFHDDKKPSMHVSPQKQIYKCFSCGAGGDVFGFVMNYHKLSFPEALRMLAERAGIELDFGQSEQQKQAQGERQRLMDANQNALAFFRAMLKKPDIGQIARDYVTRRDINGKMQAEFQVGYAPDGWDGLVNAIRGKRWDLQAFEMAGLVSPRKQGSGHYDRMRHRLIFPILDGLGRPIAFGGRKLREEDEPKYLNSPETALFNKSRTLYGLHAAKKPVIDSRTAVIVEGYTDVIACHQAGANNVMATLGTALTTEHLTELRRYAERVILVFDGDEAGQKAADRAVEIFLTGDVDVGIAVLPDGLDPAELLAREDGRDQWDAAMEGAKDALTFQFERVSKQLENASGVTGRQRVAEAYLDKLAELGLGSGGAVRRGFVVQRLSQLLHLPETTLNTMLGERSARSKRAPIRHPGSPDGVDATSDLQASHPGADAFASGDSQHKLRAVGLAQRQILGCLLKRNDLFHQVLKSGRSIDEAVPPAEFVSLDERRLYERIYQRLCDGETVTLTGLCGALAEEGQHRLAGLATDSDEETERATGGDDERLVDVFEQAVQSVLTFHQDREYRLERQAGLAGDDEQDRAAQLRRIQERLRNAPSPVRIARVDR